MTEEAENAKVWKEDAERLSLSDHSECVNNLLMETTKKLTVDDELLTGTDTSLLSIQSSEPVQCSEGPFSQEDRTMNFESSHVRMAIYERLWQ